MGVQLAVERVELLPALSSKRYRKGQVFIAAAQAAGIRELARSHVPAENSQHSRWKSLTVWSHDFDRERAGKL